jgi:hypothetical protein
MTGKVVDHQRHGVSRTLQLADDAERLADSMVRTGVEAILTCAAGGRITRSVSVANLRDSVDKARQRSVAPLPVPPAALTRGTMAGPRPGD